MRDDTRVGEVVDTLEAMKRAVVDIHTVLPATVMAMEIGRRSVRTVIELGISTTLSYLVILVTKERGERSSAMGIRTRRVRQLL